MRARLLKVAIVATMLVVPFQRAVAATTRPTTSGRHNATIGPLHSGTSAYVGGTFVWTGYAYNDHGPNTAKGTPGTATYPDPGDQSNAANLIQLQVSGSERRLSFRAVLETLTRPDRPSLGFGIDTDNDISTGAPSVPGGGWRNSDPLGLDAFVTASADGGVVHRWTGAIDTAWEVIQRMPVAIDTGGNHITTTADMRPFRLGRTVRMVGVAGLRRPEASWLTGKGPIYNLAFVTAEDPAARGGMLSSAQTVAATGNGHATGGTWQDIRQADVLSGHLEGSNAVATIDLETMRARRTVVPPLDATGYHTWLYYSEVDLPEGIVDGTAAGGLWAGPFQPYLVQVPPNPTPDLPVLVYLHGGGGNHLDNGIFAPQGPMRTGRSIAVFPFGRQPTTANDHGYAHVAEKDVLDVLTDVRRRYRTDPDRTLVTGVSTGGAGAWRMAQLHPDLFSAAYPISAYDDTHLAQNTINVPLVLHNGGADPAVSPPVVALTLRQLDEIGDVGYRSYTVADSGHADPTAPIAQCLVDGLLQRTVVRDPARVVLGLDPKNDPPGMPAGTELDHGDAYWVSGVRVRAGAPPSMWHTPVGDPPAYGANAVAAVDVISLARSDRATFPTPVETVGQNITTGATLCGPDATTRTNDAWRVHGIDLLPGAPQPTSNGAAMVLRQVDALTLDLPPMRLSTERPLHLDVTGDGPTAFRLIGPWDRGMVTVAVDGRPIGGVRAHHRALTFSADVKGTHRITVTRHPR